MFFSTFKSLSVSLVILPQTVWTTIQLSQKAQHKCATVWNRGGSGKWRADLALTSSLFCLSGFWHPDQPPFTNISIILSPCPYFPCLSQSLSLSATGQRKRRGASGSDTSVGDEHSSCLSQYHSFMSWDSNIFARVFFTLRAVRREAGL